MKTLSIRWLGLPSIELDGQELSFERRKGVALLAFLSVSGKPQTRSSLATLFWPEIERKSALAYLRRTLWSLNQVLPAGVLLTDRKTVTLHNPTDNTIDVAQFSQIDSLIAAQNGPPSAEFLAQLEQITAVYRGDFLEGFTLDDSSEFDLWQSLQTERFRQMLLRAYQYLLSHLINQKLLDNVRRVVNRWLQIDPLAEPAHHALLQLYLLDGRREEGIRHYEQFRSHLHKELQVEPSHALMTIYQQLRQVERTPPVVVRPRRVLPAISTGCPALPPLRQAMFGRNKEQQALTETLIQPHQRLVTISGCAGVGKSTLARHTVEHIGEQFSDGIYFATLPDGQTTLTTALACAVGMRCNTPIEPVIQHLRGRDALLVIDNLDLRIGERDLIPKILKAVPTLTLLVTSRIRLNLREEKLFILNGLSVAAATNQLSDAATYFVHAAQQVVAQFSADSASIPTISSICQQLDGHPLAIGLAAEWVRLYSIEALAEQIQQSPDFLKSTYHNVAVRHQSMRHLFNSAWQTLSAEEQAAISRLAVHQHTFDLQAAQGVSGLTVKTILNLTNKSMLLISAERQFCIPTLFAPFVQAQLAQSSERKRLAARHATFYLRRIDHRLWSQTQPQSAKNKALTTTQLANYRQAWRWFTVYGTQHQLIEGAKSISKYFESQAQSGIAISLFEDAVDMLVLQADKPLALAWIQAHQAYHLTLQFDYTRATYCLQQVITMQDSGSDDELTAFCLRQLTALRAATTNRDSIPEPNPWEEAQPTLTQERPAKIIKRSFTSSVNRLQSLTKNQLASRRNLYC